MNLQELRIGNYVMQRGETTIVESIKFSLNDWQRINGLIYKSCTPIPITEEWLLNFNFELKSMVNGKVLVYRNNMLAVSFNTDNKIISIHIGIQRIDDGKKIKYVHQIQNLYFDLTGQELFIKNQE
jgi:hypothetical protein